jgi:hypothetical protein
MIGVSPPPESVRSFGFRYRRLRQNVGIPGTTADVSTLEIQFRKHFYNTDCRNSLDTRECLVAPFLSLAP